MTTIIAAVTPTWMISNTSRQSCKKPRTASIWSSVRWEYPPSAGTRKGALLAALGGLGDSQKFSRLEAGAADQGAIDVACRQQFGGIAVLHRAAIKKTYPSRLAHQPAQHLANVRMRCSDLGGRRRLARADRPHRLVGHDHLGRARSAPPPAPYPRFQHRHRPAALPLRPPLP